MHHSVIISVYFCLSHQTANALSFAIYNLSRNVEKQERLAGEICRVLQRGQPVTAEDIISMPYLKACVKESFRYVV